MRPFFEIFPVKFLYRDGLCHLGLLLSVASCHLWVFSRLYTSGQRSTTVKIRIPPPAELLFIDNPSPSKFLDFAPILPHYPIFVFYRKQSRSTNGKVVVVVVVLLHFLKTRVEKTDGRTDGQREREEKGALRFSCFSSLLTLLHKGGFVEQSLYNYNM